MLSEDYHAMNKQMESKLVKNVKALKEMKERAQKLQKQYLEIKQRVNVGED